MRLNIFFYLDKVYSLLYLCLFYMYIFEVEENSPINTQLLDDFLYCRCWAFIWAGSRFLWLHVLNRETESNNLVQMSEFSLRSVSSGHCTVSTGHLFNNWRAGYSVCPSDAPLEWVDWKKVFPYSQNAYVLINIHFRTDGADLLSTLLFWESSFMWKIFC